MKRLSQEAAEKKYLKKMRELEREAKPFHHRLMCDFMGWRSVAASWFMQERLIEKGMLVKGERLAYQSCPVVTSAGQRVIKRAA